MEKKYYIAYGSNLNIRQMASRCPGASVRGTSEIRGYRLMFKGSRTGSYLTIEKADGFMVPVAVWEVTPQDEVRLDRYEGFPSFYYKKNMELTVGGQTLTAFVYIMHEERRLGIPSYHYIDTCREGYEDFGFDEDILAEAYEYSQKGALKGWRFW